MEINLLALLVGVVILVLVYWAIHRLASTFGLSPQIVTVIDIILVVIAVLWLLSTVGLLNVPVRIS